MSDRKNLKVDKDTYDLLRDRKGENLTWGEFFRSLCVDGDLKTREEVAGQLEHVEDSLEWHDEDEEYHAILRGQSIALHWVLGHE